MLSCHLFPCTLRLVLSDEMGLGKTLQVRRSIGQYADTLRQLIFLDHRISALRLPSEERVALPGHQSSVCPAELDERVVTVRIFFTAHVERNRRC